METLLPTHHQINLINASREDTAHTMLMAGTPDARLLALTGVCAADANLMPNGHIGATVHAEDMAVAAAVLPDTQYIARSNGEKPRTHTGYTGLLHQSDGPKLYVHSARHLTSKGVALAAEVMDDTGFAIAGPYLSVGWIGARNDQDTGPRYLGRPTSEDQDRGVHPLPMFVKNSADGSLNAAVHALRTLRSEKPESRLRLSLDGMRTVDTHANLSTGLILRGCTEYPGGDLDEVLAEELITARELMDKEFGADTIPIVLDISHAHANWEGGGEAGQLRIAAALARLVSTGIRLDGYMAETYILPGKQEAGGTTPGLSWTDKCIRQDKAQELLGSMNAAWAERPAAHLSLASART